MKAAEIHREEISLGQLAQQSGTTPRVKELGRMMEMAHTKSLTDIVELANRKNVTLPESQTEDGDKAYKKLSEKSNKDFDKEYAKMMVNQHEDAIDLFETASNKSADPDIRSWALASLPELRVHLEHSLTCKEESDKM